MEELCESSLHFRVQTRDWTMLSVKFGNEITRRYLAVALNPLTDQLWWAWQEN
jgi:hypothetical protein